METEFVMNYGETRDGLKIDRSHDSFDGFRH